MVHLRLDKNAKDEGVTPTTQDIRKSMLEDWRKKGYENDINRKT